MKAKMLLVVSVMVVVLSLGGNAFALWQYQWVGGTSDDWSVGSNWNYGDMPNGSAANITTGNAVIYSGTQSPADFTMFVGGSADVSLTIKSGATLAVSTYNIDLGYVNAGSYKTIFTVENLATASCAGTFNTRRPGLTQTNLAGTIDAGHIDIAMTTHINFASTGKMLIHDNVAANFLNTSSWVTEGLITINGIAYGQAGWQGFSSVYDAGQNLTTITPLPEPATMILLALGGFALRRKK